MIPCLIGANHLSTSDPGFNEFVRPRPGGVVNGENVQHDAFGACEDQSYFVVGEQFGFEQWIPGDSGGFGGCEWSKTRR